MSKTPSHLVKKLADKRRFSAAMGEEGGSLVEMALSCLILIPILFGIVQLSIGLYCFHYAADAAREATRWAIVRGASCNTNFGTAYCSPTDAKAAGATGNDIAQYVRGLGYPYSGALTTTTKWCVASASTPATWSSCSTNQDNELGNQVQVTVSYAYPLVIPFVKTNTLNVSSVSSMTILQ
ncbi:MAG TPA: TadE/TadG family type IV pilus assembly protein [Terracidiphilus sp.]|jgi:Flp pilus assembly protein TadG